MKNIVLVLTLSVLVSSVLAQDHIQLSQDDLTNPQFMKIVNNYFGCKTWSQGVCTQCSQNYYFNLKGICCQVKPECQKFNRQIGICQGCYQGYEIVNGICVLADLANSKDKGCRKWNNGICSECSVRWYFGLDGRCAPVDQYCRNWRDNGECIQCYNGYIQQNGKCIRDPFQFVPSPDSLCAEWKGRVCLRCANRAYFDQNGVCKAVDNNCNTFDLFDGMCLTCYQGYNLVDGSCVLSEQKGPLDAGCKRWDWNNQKCLECSLRWIFSQDGICVPVNDYCASHASDGSCTSCYKGYELRDGACYQVTEQGPSDLGCKKWDWNNKKCLECSNRWTFEITGACVPISDLCSSYDSQGVCTACYKGYDFNNGACVLSQQKGPSDLGCKVWDWINKRCLQCSFRWIFGANGVCVQVNDFCATHAFDGSCTSCYKGYNLQQGACFLASDQGPSDIGCKRWDWNNRKCLECSARWFFGADGSCVPINQFCADHDLRGICTLCYQGYNLVDGSCVLSEQKGPLDAGCKRWDWNNQKCLECSLRWIFSQDGICVPVNDYCASHASDGSCTSCYKGYELRDGACYQVTEQGPSDLGCKKWDWNNKKCLECSERWTFGSAGTCIPVDNNCKTYNNNGQCTDCYKGYNLNNGACVLPEQKGPSDLGCKTWDWQNKRCLQCSHRWVAGPSGCLPVDNNCDKYQLDGTCIGCYQGYVLNSGNCVVQNIACKSSTVDGWCLTCYNGYVLYKKQSSITQYYRECCPEKLDALLKQQRLAP